MIVFFCQRAAEGVVGEVRAHAVAVGCRNNYVIIIISLSFGLVKGSGNGYAVAGEDIGIFGGVILHPLLYLYKPQKSTKC